MKKTESSQPENALSLAGPNVRRRSLLHGLWAWPIVPASFSAWGLKSSSSAIVLRNGWVLSKDD